MIEEWKKDITTHRAIDIVKHACHNDSVVLELLEILSDYDKDNNFLHYCSECAAGYNRVELLNTLIMTGATNWNEIACGAAEYGNSFIVNNMCTLGADHYNRIARSAAKGNNITIMKEMMEKCTKVDYNSIACGAAEGGNLDLVLSLINMGASDLEEILAFAAENGHLDIIEEMLRRGADDDYDEIAMSAAYGNHITLVYEMIERGANDWKGIASFSSNSDLSNDMISRGATNWNEIALFAAKKGNLTILEGVLDKCDTDFSSVALYGYKKILEILPITDYSILDFGAHVDCIKYFKV